MRLMFLVPLAGCLFCYLTQFKLSWLRHRFSLLTFNTSLAILASACLIKGIVEVSGRTTTIDSPYWYVAAVFLLLSLLGAIKKAN
ncbi:CrcB family protein [Streptococcus saliviloxodontae]|uniref:CrcB family protein n=1 Tax=Streptococcus saliviloxodontae TaxID=1349416 RepID=A0ABS2PLE0_9STRE|nr:CrcB family protein [Streptococcus saliviloxodontae]MBM7636255.1 hypothetical protein [Streptococcus saliviloxodontae]